MTRERTGPRDTVGIYSASAATARHKYSSRYVCALVADVHRTLLLAGGRVIRGRTYGRSTRRPRVVANASAHASDGVGTC